MHTAEMPWSRSRHNRHVACSQSDEPASKAAMKIPFHGPDSDKIASAKLLPDRDATSFPIDSAFHWIDPPVICTRGQAPPRGKGGNHCHKKWHSGISPGSASAWLIGRPRQRA